MSSAQKRTASKRLAIFDGAKHMTIDAPIPSYLNFNGQFKADYRAAHAFLYAYKDNTATFNAYRREIERLLHWSWQIAEQSIFKLQRTEIEAYIKFCRNPRKSWIGSKKLARFTSHDGKRVPNPAWRPFVITSTRKEEIEIKKQYHLSDEAIKEIFAILSSFYNFLLQENYTNNNPIAKIRQKSKFIRRQQETRKVRRLSELQWSFVMEAANSMAQEDKRHERTLFVIAALYSMYLRISELVVTPRWAPKMSDFKRDHEGNWWFTTVGKGNKERSIAVSNHMLAALKRWRKHLGLSPLPTIDDHSPLVIKERGKGGIKGTNKIREIVQGCFDRAISMMEKAGFAEEEITDLRHATVHWLRHTGISDDVKRRPREHVRDDAGHSSSQTTDRYIDIDRRDRHRSAKKKPITND